MRNLALLFRRLPTVDNAALGRAIVGNAIALLSAGSMAATYYVAPNGSDSNKGQSIGKPLRSITKAVSYVVAGDTILIRDGVYSEYIEINKNGTSAKRINIEAFASEKPIMDGSLIAPDPARKWDQPGLLAITGNFITVRGLEVRNAAAYGIHISGSDIILDSLTIHHTYLSGVRGWQADRTTISNSTIHSAYDYDLGGSGGGKDADCISFSGNLAGHGSHIISNNRFYNCSDDGLDMWYAEDSLVEHNIAYGNGFGNGQPAGDGNGFKMGPGTGGTYRNNIAYGNRVRGFDINLGSEKLIYNNTAYNNPTNFNNYSNKRNTFKNNLAYLGRTSVLGGTQVSNSWNLDITTPAFVSVDPLSSSFLLLSQRSPAIDAGTHVNSHYSGNGPDLGAYEYDPKRLTSPPNSPVKIGINKTLGL